jgi:hypothetical protein
MIHRILKSKNMNALAASRQCQGPYPRNKAISFVQRSSQLGQDEGSQERVIPTSSLVLMKVTKNSVSQGPNTVDLPFTDYASSKQMRRPSHLVAMSSRSTDITAPSESGSDCCSPLRRCSFQSSSFEPTLIKPHYITSMPCEPTKAKSSLKKMTGLIIAVASCLLMKGFSLTKIATFLMSFLFGTLLKQRVQAYLSK